jgi:hypothetical protein
MAVYSERAALQKNKSSNDALALKASYAGCFSKKVKFQNFFDLFIIFDQSRKNDELYDQVVNKNMQFFM